MPIPTRASPTKGVPTTTTARRTASRDTTSKTNNSSIKNVNTSKPETATTSTVTKPTPAPTRVIPRATTRATSSTLRPTRTPSTTTTSRRPANDTTTSSSRASSASSSTVSRPASTAKEGASTGSKAPTTTATAIRTRTASGTTTSTTTTRPPRPKPPSTTQPAARTLRSTTSSTTTSAPLAPTRTKATSTPTTSHTPQSNLASELHQLSLLHSTAQPTLNRYLTSITTQLKTQQQTLQTQQTHLQHLETAILTARSTDALDAWVHQQQRHGNSHPSRRVQALATLVRDLEALTDEDGPALQPLRAFEAWLDSAVAVRAERDSQVTDGDGLRFITGLGWAWAEAMKDLRSRVELVLVGLRELSEPEAEAWAEDGERNGVGIAVVLGRHRALAAAVLGEVDTAVLVEAALVRDEGVWQRERVGVVVRELHEDGREKRYMGAWAEE